MWIAVGATASFGAIGFVDDYLKVTRHTHHGLFARYKFASQIVVSMVGVCACRHGPGRSEALRHALYFPFVKQLHPNLGWFYIPFAVLVLVASTNTVNLTTGSTGSRSAPSRVARPPTPRCLRHQPRRISKFLLLPHIESRRADDFLRIAGGREPRLSLVERASRRRVHGGRRVAGLGGALGTVATAHKQELLLPIVGGVFVLEGLSVILQVASFKLTGKRIFRMAPLHHHFELIGWQEPKVITRFLILAILFASVQPHHAEAEVAMSFTCRDSTWWCGGGEAGSPRPVSCCRRGARSR
jgi:phospho-N-acetylmuramoyl-pentapeptide-transferase